MRDWTARQAARLVRRRAEAEVRALDDAPRLRVRWPWTTTRKAAHGDQHLRAFVQINVLPRPR